MDSLIHSLRGWREKEKKTVLNVLQSLEAVKHFEKGSSSEVLTEITCFHKEITKEKDISIEWFNLCKAIKKKLKAIVEKEEKEKESPTLKRRQTQTEYPSLLIDNRTENSQRILKYLYRNFITGIDSFNEV